MNTATATEILKRAGLNPADWNITAAVKHANRWIADQQLELAEGGDVAEFGTLELVDFLQQSVMENSPRASVEAVDELWERTEANEFASWPPVWQA